MQIRKGIWAGIVAGILVLSFYAPAHALTEIEGLVPIQEVDPAIVLDIRYATENNFTKKKIYPVAVGVLRKETALKLAAANQEFQEKGYRIKVWDGYRPPYVQKIFWGIMPDDRYVANPYKGGSRHNRGGAVDVTLVDQQGKELEMPSAYDDFSSKAWRNNFVMSSEARKNVTYLTGVMVKHGFKPYAHEWWHFDDPDYKKFPLVDVKLERFLDQPPSLALAGIVTVSLPAALLELKEDVKQVIIVNSQGGFKADLSLLERKGNGWQIISSKIPAVVGKNGLAPAGEKKEGDGRTPEGVFKLGTAFGYAPKIKTGLAYRQATENDFWVDDPDSSQYNQWVTGTPQAKSFERMKRDDDLYEYGVVLEYNTGPIIPGKGSAIFMHVWRPDGSPTAGCVALDKERLVSLLKWLDADAHPVIILKNPTEAEGLDNLIQ